MALVTRMSAVFLFVLLAGAAAAQEARTGIREGGRTIGAGQVTEILERTAGGRAGGRSAKDERGRGRDR